MTAGGLFHVRLDSPPRGALSPDVSTLSTKSLTAADEGNLASWLVAFVTPTLPDRAATAAMVGFLYFIVRCSCLSVECRPKSPRDHFNTLLSAVVISEVLRAAAATVARAPRELSVTTRIAAARCCSVCNSRCVSRPPPAVRSLSFAVLALASCFVLLGFSSIPALKNDLHSDAAWRPPAVYAYSAGLSFVSVVLIVVVLNAAADYRNRRVLCSAAVQTALTGALLVGVALAIARRGDGGQPHDYTKAACLPTLHLHHWIGSGFLFQLLALPTAWSCALIARALLFGIFISGLAAYGADGLLDSGMCPRA